MGVGLRGVGELVLLGLAVGLLGGCGGDDDLSRSEAIAKVNAFCRDSAERGSQIASGLDTGSDESFLDTIRAQVREKDHLQAQLDALPLGGPSQQVADYAANQDREAQAAQSALTAIETDNSVESPAVREGLAKLKGAGDASAEAAEKAGLDDCGPAVRELEIAGRPFDAGTKPRSFAGSRAIIAGSGFTSGWKGFATQNGPGEHETRTYPVYMAIDSGYGIPPGGGSASEDLQRKYWGNGDIRYPSFHCSGRVKIVEAGSGPDGFGYRYELEERINYGRDKCGTGGTITAVTEGDELDWRWKDGDVEATAILDSSEAPEREAVSEQTIRELQGHEYSGTVTQWGPRGQKASYELYYVLYPPDGPRFGPGDGHTQSYDGPCMGNGVLTVESVAGDRAVLRRRFDRYSNCIGGGVVETRLVGDKLLFRWLRQGDDERGEQDDAIALGTLSESGPARGPAPG